MAETQRGIYEAAKFNTPIEGMSSIGEHMRRVRRAQEAAVVPVELFFTAADKMDIAWLEAEITGTDIVGQIDWARKNLS